MPHERILIIEDHLDLLKEMSDVLTDAGYQVQTATRGADALALAHQSTFDLVLADIFLPDSSGIQIFRQIREQHPDLAGVVITAHSTWELALEALRAGFVGFLVKPIVPEQLLTSVFSALEQEKLRRENARLRALVPLYELSRTFMRTTTLQEVLDQIVNLVRQETQSDTVSLMLLDETGSELCIAAATGLPNQIIETERRALGDGIAGRVAQTGEPLILAEGLVLDPEIRQAMTQPRVGSSLSVPLKLRGCVIGVLNLSRLRESVSFTHADLEFATVLASQAAIAIDQTRWMTQIQQLSEISQRLARAVDLEEACAIILNAPLAMLKARGAALWIIEGMPTPLFRSVGRTEAEIPKIDIAHITETFLPGEKGSWLTLPIRHSDKTLGALAVRLASACLPSEENLNTLRTLAHTAGAVIEAHRLRAREERALREMDRAVRADLNMRDLLDRLLNEMIETCQAAGGAIFLHHPERQRLEPGASRNVTNPAALLERVPHPYRALCLPDTLENQFLLSAPLATGNYLAGLVILVRPASAGEFSTRQLDLLSTLASVAALAVRNAQLYARSEEAAIAEERTRIAREIHDGLAQDLSYLVLKISVAQKLALQGKEQELHQELNDISEQLRRDARDVRRIIFALRPIEIETQGFLPALEKYIKEFATVNELDITFNARDDFSHLPPKLETALFRLTQEMLNNIRKHAKAKHVWIDLSISQPSTVALSVRDDGIGFDVAAALQAAQARGSVGLVQMRERVERAGGTFAINTAPHQGTRIDVKLPIREA